MPSSREGPPSIWDTHGVPGNVFADQQASSSAPYPKELHQWNSIEEPLHSSTVEKSGRQEQNQDLRCQSGPSAKDSVIFSGRDSFKNYGADQQRLQISDLQDHVVAVVDVRRAYFYAEPLPKTFVELSDYFDIDTRTRCCGRLRRCLYGTRQAARSWQREMEKGIKAAGMEKGEMSKCSFKSPCGKLVGVVHGDEVQLSGPRSLVEAVRNSLRTRYEIREHMLGASC